MKNALFYIFTLVSGVSFAMSSPQKPPVKTVDSVNLQQYIGKWYEVASIPMWFQKDCVANTSAEYSFAENNLIKVHNSCDTQDGQRKFAEGRAKVTDEKTNSKLKVTFVKIIDWVFAFGGNYWIIDLAQDYSYAVIGDPTREYGWILSRDPSLSQDKLIAAEKALTEQGYDTCLLLTSIQAGGFSARTPLCEAVKNF